jgi:hypothetical protein
VIVFPTKYFGVIIVEKNGVNSGFAIGTFTLRSYIEAIVQITKMYARLTCLMVVTNSLRCLLQRGRKRQP